MIRLSGIPRMYIASPNATVIMGIELSVSISKGRLNDCSKDCCRKKTLAGVDAAEMKWRFHKTEELNWLLVL